MADLIADVVPSSLDALLWTFASTGVGASIGLLATYYGNMYMPINPNIMALYEFVESLASNDPGTTPFYQLFNPKYHFGLLTLVELSASIYAAGQLMSLIVPAAGESPIGDGTLMFFLLISQPLVILDVFGLISQVYSYFFPPSAGSPSQLGSTAPSASDTVEMAEKMITKGSASQNKEGSVERTHGALAPQLNPNENLPVPLSPYSFGTRHTAFTNFR